MQSRLCLTLLLLGSALAGGGCASLQTRSPSTAWGDIATDTTTTETPGSDRDKDTVTDDRERALGSDPDSADSDKDGYADGYEDRLADFGFDLTKSTTDRDSDGLSDDREATAGTTPHRPTAIEMAGATSTKS